MKCFTLNATSYDFIKLADFKSICYHLASSALSVFVKSPSNGHMHTIDKPEACNQEGLLKYANINKNFLGDSLDNGFGKLVDIPLFMDSDALILHHDGTDDNVPLLNRLGLDFNGTHYLLNDVTFNEIDCPDNKTIDTEYLKLMIPIVSGLGIVASCGVYFVYKKYLEYKLRNLVNESVEQKPELKAELEEQLQKIGKYTVAELKSEIVELKAYNTHSIEENNEMSYLGENSEHHSCVQ